MTYAISGGAVMGAAQLNESQLDRLTRKLRASFRGPLRWMEAICTQLKQ